MMRRIMISELVIVYCLISAVVSFAQSSQFDLFQDYQEFLEQHRNMTSSELLQMHPIGSFKDDVNVSWESVVHYELIDARYNLTTYEKSLLRSHGFVVSERLRSDTFVGHLVDIWKHDLALFISTDALLHAVHYYCDQWMLSDIESGALCSLLAELLSKMHAEIPTLSAMYSDEADMRLMLEDGDLYLTVAMRLLGEDSAIPYVVGNATLSEILDLIDAETLAAYPLFSQTCREIDFSQFRPRGHYSQNERLAKYFRGQADNDPDSVYVAIEDYAGQIVVVMHPEDDAVLTTEWRKWHIALMDLQISGVDTAAVTKMHIGVGDRDSLKPGGYGWIYVDDICVTSRMP